ncbi:hypothetical protein ACLK2H_09245 [Escherichia coli]
MMNDGVLLDDTSALIYSADFFPWRAIMLRRYRFELILALLIICALIATQFFFLLSVVR